MGGAPESAGRHKDRFVHRKVHVLRPHLFDPRRALLFSVVATLDTDDELVTVRLRLDADVDLAELAGMAIDKLARFLNLGIRPEQFVQREYQSLKPIRLLGHETSVAVRPSFAAGHRPIVPHSKRAFAVAGSFGSKA